MKDYQVLFGGIKKINRHLNEGISFFLILRGEVTLECNGKVYEMTEDSCLVVNDGDIYSMEGQKANVVLIVSIRFQYLQRECPEILRFSYRCRGEEDPEKQGILQELKQRIAKMTFLYLNREEGWEFLFRSQIQKSLRCLYLHFRTEKEGAALAAPDDQRMHSVLEYIQKNYSQRISLKDLAEREYLTPSYISRLFHRKMGVNLTKYLSALRLEAAVRELLETSHTVTQIAMNNGFSGPKAFGQQFKEMYHESPAEYRKKNREHKTELPAGDSFLKIVEAGSMDALIRYLKVYHQDWGKTTMESVEIDTDCVTEECLPQCPMILNLGFMRQALRYDVWTQIREMNKKLRFQYVYLWGFIGESFETVGRKGYLKFSDYYDLFNLVEEYGWIPFIRIEVRELTDREHFGSRKEALEYFRDLLSRLLWRYDKAFLNCWKFDIVGSPEELEQYYGEIEECIHLVFEKAETGFYIRFTRKESWTELKGVLAQRALKKDVRFVTFDVDHNTVLLKNQEKDTLFYKNYNKNQLAGLKTFVEQAGLSGLRYYLLDWNTLTGSNFVEAGEFHRSALLADQFIRNRAIVDGLGISLNLFNPYGTESPWHVTYSLSLFLYKTIKRTSFFIFQMLELCRGNLIYRGENAIASKEREGCYTVLLFNPQYMEPERTLDNIRQETYLSTFQVCLKHLESGHYRIKKMTLDKNHGSLYHSMAGIDRMHSLNMEEIDQYLIGTVFPDVVVYEEEIDGTYTFRQNLLLNAVVFYTIRRLY